MFQEGLPFVPFILGQNYNSGESILSQYDKALELIVNPDYDDDYTLNLICLKSIDSSKLKVTLNNGSEVTLGEDSWQTTQKYKAIHTPSQKGTENAGWRVYYDNTIILSVVFIAS